MNRWDTDYPSYLRTEADRQRLLAAARKRTRAYDRQRLADRVITSVVLVLAVVVMLGLLAVTP